MQEPPVQSPGGEESLEYFWSSLWLRWSRRCLQCSRPGFDPWVWMILGRRAWQATVVFLPEESPWTEVPGGLQATGSQRVRHDWATRQSAAQDRIVVQSPSRVLPLAAAWITACQAPCPSPSPGVCPCSCPLHWWCYSTISPSVNLPSGSFPMSQLFPSGGQSIEFQLQHQSFQWTPRTDLLQDGLVGSPWSPWDSQESSPTPQFKSINSSDKNY